MYCLRGEDVAFYICERQLEGGDSPEVGTIEVRFKGSMGNQLRKGAVLERIKGDGDKGGKRWSCCRSCTGA